MTKKYGFESTNFRGRRRVKTGSQDDDVTQAFKDSARRAVESALKKGLPVPTIVDGVLVNVMPDGSTIPIKMKF